jgi:excisionase family DNA binding protein
MGGRPLALSELLTSEQVGVLLGGKHPKTVLKAFRRGELPGIKLGARTVRFDPADVQAYIDAHRVMARDAG